MTSPEGSARAAAAEGVITPEAVDETVRVGVKLLHAWARLPARAYEGDAAFDLFSAEDADVPPHGRALVGTGIALDLPPGVAALTLPRSGLALRHGVTLVNTPGLIDPGYRGEVKLIVLNTDAEETFSVRAGERVAQLLVVALTPVVLAAVDEIADTGRGPRGFGSSGRS